MIQQVLISFLLPLAALAADRQEARQLTLPTGEIIDYLLYTPAESANAPLLLFLHGGGESGRDLAKVKTHGPPKEIENGRDYPMFVVSPLNPDKTGFWDEDRLARFLDALRTELKFDQSRLYLAGMSRGAYGAYRLAMEDPKRFAALIALCGAAPAPYAKWLGDLPVWIIHGEKDQSIPVEQSRAMARALEQAGHKPRLTIHPDAGHDVWTRTFQSPETIKWLLAHHRK